MGLRASFIRVHGRRRLDGCRLVHLRGRSQAICSGNQRRVGTWLGLAGAAYRGHAVVYRHRRGLRTLLRRPSHSRLCAHPGLDRRRNLRVGAFDRQADLAGLRAASRHSGNIQPDPDRHERTGLSRHTVRVLRRTIDTGQSCLDAADQYQRDGDGRRRPRWRSTVSDPDRAVGRIVTAPPGVHRVAAWAAVAARRGPALNGCSVGCRLRAAHPQPQCRKIWRVVADIAGWRPSFHGRAVGAAGL
jgi:hypothetical protein